MNSYSTEGQDRYMRGLWGAEAKGQAAAEDPQFSENDCPYKGYEHRFFWLEGFRKVRKAQT